MNVYTEEGGEKLSTDNNGYIIYTEGEEKILVGYNGNQDVLELQSDITKINYYAFSNFSRLKNITLPNSITSIGKAAFYNCSNLTSITIPNSVTEIGEHVFYNCGVLMSITFEDTTTLYNTTAATDWENKINGIATDVTNPYQNATYFKSTYSDRYWYKD